MKAVQFFVLSPFVLLLCGACAEGGGVGAACEFDEDCKEGLICDIHDDKGSCQEAHLH